jgi:hypothetical protein
VVVPQVDFSKHSVVIVALGRQSSLGHSVRLNHHQAVLEHGKLHLPMTVTRPDQDKYQAQVITSPCQIVALPKINFSEILLDSL